MKSYNEILEESKYMTYDELYAYLEPYFIEYVKNDYKNQINRYQQTNIVPESNLYISVDFDRIQIANCICVDEISEVLKKEIEKVKAIYKTAYNFQIYADADDINLEFKYIKIKDENAAILIANNLLDDIVWKLINEKNSVEIYSVYNKVYQFQKNIDKCILQKLNIC